MSKTTLGYEFEKLLLTVVHVALLISVAYLLWIILKGYGVIAG